jgi:two-component sensor histidine kinase
MQVIHSLLNLQAKAIEDPGVRSLFDESRDRVKSMALIHERLYRSADLAHIDFREYCQNLVREIFSSYHRPGVDFLIDINDILLDINTGIPCGLIINELVSNALKHAFPEGVNGTVCIGMTQSAPGRYWLTVEDNGSGFPAGVDFHNSSSLGLQLVRILVEQLQGTIELETGPGTLFRIAFAPLTEDGMEHHG